MKWVLCLVAAAAFAQDDLLSVLKGSDSAKQEMQKAEVAKAAAQGHKSSGEGQVFMINPAERAKDYKDAFDFLRTQKSASKVSFVLTDGKVIGNIVDVTLPSSGSLLIFRLSTTQGTKYQVVKVEDIASLEQM